MRMQAILHVHPESAYAKSNGKVMNVMQLLPSMVALEVRKSCTSDFTFAEVTIMNFEYHIQAAFDAYNWYGNSETRRNFESLKAYAVAKGITYTLEENCPA